MIDLQNQLDSLSTIDELGRWQGKIAEACDCPKLKEKVLAMATYDFLSTMDATICKLSPARDLVRLWYAAASMCSADMKKLQGISLSSDDSGEKDKAKVLRPSALTSHDMANVIWPYLKGDKLPKLVLPQRLESLGARPVIRRKALLEDPAETTGEKEQHVGTVPDKVGVLQQLPNKLAVQRAVSSLQALLGKRMDRKFEAIISKISDGQTLATVVSKFWAKKSPGEQIGLESDLLEWL